MRIVLAVPSLGRDFGGPSAKALRMAAALRDLGHVVAVVGCGEAEDAVGLPVIGRFHATPVPRSTRRLRRLVRSADVVHVLGYRDPVGSVAVWSARRCGVPIVFEPVGMLRPQLRSRLLKRCFDAVVGKWLVASATLIVATSAAEEQDLVSCGTDPSRIRVRPNGVDVSDLLPLPAPGAMRVALGLDRDAPLILALARLARVKGLEHLVEAVAEIPEAVCVIAGPDEDDGTLRRLERLRKDLGSGDRIRILAGGVWGADKAQALADADCLCLPSRSESFGQAAAEAGAVGLPVVLSDGCGVAPWLDVGATRVFPYADVPALTSALRRVLLEPDAREAARQAAPAVREKLDWATIAVAQETLYAEATG